MAGVTWVTRQMSANMGFLAIQNWPSRDARQSSPLDIGAPAEAVVVADWSKVVQLAATVQLSGISIQSKL
jgi:hypothetical protein